MHTFNIYTLSNFILKLKQKWKVNWLQFALIVITFALGGSSCAYLSKKILSICFTEKNIIYYTIYIILITLLWPFCVLLISVFFGQFVFFKKYIKRISERIFGKK